MPDEEVLRVLGDRKQSLSTVPRQDEKASMLNFPLHTSLGLTVHLFNLVLAQVVLRKNANISSGGTAHDVTDRVHPRTVQV